MAMELIEEEDFAAPEAEAGPALGRRGRGRGGPVDVTFSVYVHPAPAVGETVFLTSTIQELVQPQPMQPNGTGDRKLWNVTVQINASNVVAPQAQQAPAALIGLMTAGSVLGNARGASSQPPTFEYSYSVQNAAGTVVRQEEARAGEQGDLKTFYYHRAKLGGTDSSQDEGFKLFVHDEIFQLQSGNINARDFHRRIVALAGSGFTKKHQLMGKAFEELITHWGMDTPAPAQVVLAVAAALGAMKRQSQGGLPGVGMYGYDGFDDYGFHPAIVGGGPSKAEKDAEKQEPPSLMVCRWIVKHCPSRADLEEEQRGQERERGRETRTVATTAGVRMAAETLYKEESTFDWLKLLSFLPEHSLPQPVSASQVNKDEGKKLADSFLRSMETVFQDFVESRERFEATMPADAKERQKQEQDMQQRVELFLRGLCQFCPSVMCMTKLVLHARKCLEALVEVMIPMIFGRFRSLSFGKEDKEQLRQMITNGATPFMHCDEAAISLLQNQNHPNEAFPQREIVEFIKLMTQTGSNVRPAGPQLQNAARRWLVRYYGRPVDRPMERKEDKMSLSEMSRTEYQVMKKEVKEAMRNAIGGWHLILDLPCFKMEEETVRNLLFELSQSYFFKDQDPMLVLDCILELENTIADNMRVWQLEVEIQRIAIKCVRDAQDASETEHDANLLQLLFETPTKLRYIIIEAFAAFRQASADLARLLQNEPIWSRLLSKRWLGAPGINECPLYNTQQTGMKMLKDSADRLDRGTINLSALHVIIRYRKVYESLVAQVATKPTAIPESDAKLKQFDTEYDHLRAYVKMFCSSAGIEAADLQRLIDGISESYNVLELKAAAEKFTGLEVRPHLSWLFSLKGSDVFSGIWKATARPEGEHSERKIHQEEVVSAIIPAARKTWEDLAASVETGQAVLKDIKWVVEYTWNKVHLELKLLESTAPKTKPWVPEATELCKSMRLAAKLREWAPSMLHLRNHSLSELFKDAGKDECVEKLNQVVREYEHMWEMTLGEMTDRVAPYRETINTLSEPMQDYTITAAKHDKSLEWLLQHSSTEDFNRLISLCTPNTDDPIILAAIASLKQMRTFLAEALFTKPPYSDLKKFIEELSRLTVDDAEQQCLQSVQTSFDPMLDLLTTHSRTPGVQACYDLKKISQTGTFHVTCALTETAQLRCKMADSEFDYEALAELRRQLLMTDVPYELDGAKDLPAMLETLVQKLQLLEEFGRCTMELFRLGHFAYRLNNEVLVVPPEDTVESVTRKLEEKQQQLEDWQQAVGQARSKHYFLNYYTVRELCFLTDQLPEIGNDQAWRKIWPLLQCVDLQANADETRKRIISSLKGNLGLLRASSSDADKEVKLLNDVGQLLNDLFEGVAPQVRPLKGLTEVKQQLQGDLLIRSMQNKEQGVPIFVCCADEACKVTELVLSIYTRRERVPEAEELLLCSSHTTLEEIELLLRRFFHARKHQREDRLYCVGNVHLLPYVTQCGTVEALRKMEEQFGFEHASALVFASGMPNQMLLNALNRHNLAVSILQQDLLKNAVSMVGEKYHGRQIQAIAAQMNGVGKTHHIRREIHALQADHDNKPLLHHVEIREATDISALVSNLLNDPTDPKTPTAIHIDLAHILPSHVDTLLFELLIVGMLRDTHNCEVYHRRKIDFFFIEIPNTPGESTAKQLSFCLILPRKFLEMSADRIDFDMPAIKEVDGAPMIEFVKNDLLELVGKTLRAMKVEAFNPKSRHFDVQWTGVKAAPIKDTEKEVLYGLLEEVCSSETSPPSFLVFMNLVKFLGNLIKSAEEWNMMNLALLQNFDPGLKHFKHCFFRLLIETSRDFALRQVPKAMDFKAPSVLAPQQVTLGRGQSRGSNPDLPPELLRGLSGMSSAAPALHRKISGKSAAPSLHRQHSRAQQELQAQHEADAKLEKEGVGRIEAAQYVERFDQMPSWESCVHPVANFKKNERGAIIGCNIMSLQKDFIGHFIDRNLQNSLNLNDLKLDRDWSKVTHQDAVQLVHHIEGGALLSKKDHLQGPKDYVVTVDNLIKLMSIQQRLKYGLPVILMGETGCGKTALVKFLAETLDFKLFTLDIHGGITDASIIAFLEDAIKNCDSDKGVLVFFDEINAANCMALFKTIIIDRMYGNKVIPENVRIISCCNPYRRRRNKELEDVALVYSGGGAGDAATGISDPMKELVYRVHPLPESLIDVVSDFGALSEASEELYIKAILRKELPRLHEAPERPAGQADMPDDYEVFMNAFCELLCESQKYVREVNEGERSVVSMRDIGRAARVFKWFLTSYAKLRGDKDCPAVRDDKDGTLKINVGSDLRENLRSALILTLGYCYHSRLNRNQRWGYRKRLCETWERLRSKDDGAMEWLRLEEEKELNNMLMVTQYDFVSQMDLGEGIALNEALRENLFMLLVSVMNQIPILLIGKPGCSKSLAMGVLQNNLNGEVSSREFFKSMPAVDVFAYQCSPLSTPDAVLNAFHSARQSNLGHKSTIVCVLLDEVGLAEESPHLPLKVLHKELEDLRGIACVGISNWALDAAKMSRCVTLYRPPPTVEDLSVTAEGMVQSANLKAYLRNLSEAFAEIYKRQKRADFFGMREFYSTVRVINAELKVRMNQGLEAVLEPKVLMKTVQRNFGGRPEEELEAAIEEFFERTGMDFQEVPKLSCPDLIRQNLEESDARHLMLLTKNNAALRLLFEGGLLDHGRAEVMFGSTFPNDLSDMFVAMNLQRIKSFMQQPISLVMVHCDSLYESLYDLLNQHYMEYAGQRYVRIAHGSKAKQCPIHKLFRVIVITEISDAYFRLAPPLLNRFEKQIFLRKDLMSKSDEALLARVTKFWMTLNELMNAGKTLKEDDALEEAVKAPMASGTMLSTASHRPIAGYHPELLSSLVFTLRKTHAGRSLDELVEIAKRAITWVLTPEAVCITAATLQPAEMQMKFGFDIVSEYFEQQRHSDLPSFAELTVQNKDFWCDRFGSQTMVMTYSPIRGKVGGELSKAPRLVARAEVSLHELSSSTDIEKAVHDFYNLQDTAGKKNFLIIHADPVAASVRMIEHCRFVCEKARNGFCQKEKGKAEEGSMFVVLVVHLQRGYDGKFSFDFDSQWSAVFLDSVEPSADLSSMPSLGAMLNMPLIDVVEGLEFPKLLKSCFRSSLSRLMYPHSRRPDDLQKQIQLMLRYIEDIDFVKMVRDWVLHVLRSTPKNNANPAEGSVGDDKHWFAAIASAAQELALAGTFRAALHGRVVVLVGSLLSALLAHLDRNAGLELLDVPMKREPWLKLSTASLLSPLSARLQNEAISAITESATAQHEVGTDAYTGARPFGSRFPASWFISKVIDGVRHIIEQNPPKEQLAALESQYKLSKLAEIGINPEMEQVMLDDYMADFTAMHLDWTQRIGRDVQLRILKKTLTRLRQKTLTSILEVHQLFWSLEREVAFSVSLLNAVPAAVPEAERLIEEAELNSLYYDLLLLVHETLASELADLASMPKEKSQELYREWLMRKLVVAGLTKDKLLILSGQQGVDEKKIQKLKSSTEPRIETLALVLQHVAYPLELPPEVVRNFARDLPKDKIRYSGTLLAMLNFGQVVVNHMSSGLKENALQAMSSFIESWFLDVCLRDAEAMNDLEQNSLRLVCFVAAGLPTLRAQAVSGIAASPMEGWCENMDSGIAQLSEGLCVPRSSCLNLALLRKLIVSSNGPAKATATKTIEELLTAIAKHEKHNDTLFATRYAILQEEDKTADHGKCVWEDPDAWPLLKLEDVFNPDVKADTAKMLQLVGKVRCILSMYAQILCQDPVDLELHNVAVPKVDGLLQTSKPEFHSVCRSMRLYLLKCMERQRGLSFVRGSLAEAPLSDTSWVMKWRDLHDIDFEKFIGAALVPKWNPFSGETQDLAEYNLAMTAVVELMTTCSTAKLTKFALEMGTLPEERRRKHCGGLLLAVCQEPGLLAALEEPNHRPPWRELLSNWLRDSQELKVTAQERQLLRVFSGDDHPIRCLTDSDQKNLETFVTYGGRKMDDLLRWRVLGHLAAVLLAAPETSLLHSLRILMLDASSMVDGKSPLPFFPAMDEDIRSRVLKALVEKGENIWKFKSHWYKCTCGYTFFIGECGRPMEVAKCPGCGLNIGGKDHNKTTDTYEDDESDRSPWGYMLPVAEKDERHVSFREVQSSSARAIRLLLHGAMYIGIMSVAKPQMPRVFDKVVNGESMCTMRQRSEPEYIQQHFNNDWKSMVEILSSNTEDLAVGMHNLLLRMSEEAKDESVKPPDRGDTSTWGSLTLAKRNSWEETIETKYLKSLIKNLDDSLQELYKTWGGDQEDGKFVAELKEAADVRDFPSAKREAEMPQLWAFRSAVTLDALHNKIGVESNAKESFPVLCTVLQNPLINILPALGTLVGVFEWQQLCINNFSGRITKADAGNMTVADVLEKVPRTVQEQQQWKVAFKQFERAWRLAMPYCEFECLQITEQMRSYRISEEDSILRCIPDSKDDGMYALAVIDWLVAQHNQLVQIVAGTLGYPPRKVSSRLLAQHDVVKYSKHDLMRFLTSRCATWGVGGKLNLDLKQVESHLRREMSRPEVTIEMRGFQWLGESFSAGGELRSVIKQRDLLPDTIDRLKMEIASPAIANTCLQKVEMAIAFILKSGSSLGTEKSGEMLLADYMRSVLAESPENFMGSAACADVRLQHVDNYVRILKQVVNKDPLDSIDPKYKEDLPKDLQQKLIAAKDSLPDQLVDLMGTFGETRLTETYIGVETEIMSILQSIRDYTSIEIDDETFEAIETNFPPDLKMRHWAEAYKLLRS